MIVWAHLIKLIMIQLIASVKVPKIKLIIMSEINLKVIVQIKVPASKINLSEIHSF